MLMVVMAAVTIDARENSQTLPRQNQNKVNDRRQAQE
jgi:hypothetical protein